MPAPFVPKRVRDYIYYYYAKLVIAPSAGFAGNYRFIVDTYKRLRSGEKQISDYDREIIRLAHSPDSCSYCGIAGDGLSPSEVVPKELGGPIGIHNMVMACSECIGSKGTLDLVNWWLDVLGKPLDTLPRVPIGLYLKIAFEAHQINFSLDEKCTDLAQLFPLLGGQLPDGS